MTPRGSIWCTISLTSLFLGVIAHAESEQSQDLAALRRKMENLHQAAKFSEELPLAEKALTISEKSFGADHPEAAKSLRNLEDVYVGLADYTKAEALYQRAMTLSEKALGPDHPETALTLNKLGEL